MVTGFCIIAVNYRVGILNCRIKWSMSTLFNEENVDMCSFLDLACSVEIMTTSSILPISSFPVFLLLRLTEAFINWIVCIFSTSKILTFFKILKYLVLILVCMEYLLAFYRFLPALYVVFLTYDRWNMFFWFCCCELFSVFLCACVFFYSYG